LEWACISSAPPPIPIPNPPSFQIDVSGADLTKFDDSYFKKAASKGKKGDFTEDDTASGKVKADAGRKADQKALDKPLIDAIKKVDLLKKYMATTFSLSKGQYPHKLVF
jgi:large subunit ribosomal protein L6e